MLYLDIIYYEMKPHTFACSISIISIFRVSMVCNCEDFHIIRVLKEPYKFYDFMKKD